MDIFNLVLSTAWIESSVRVVISLLIHCVGKFFTFIYYYYYLLKIIQLHYHHQYVIRSPSGVIFKWWCEIVHFFFLLMLWTPLSSGFIFPFFKLRYSWFTVMCCFQMYIKVIIYIYIYIYMYFFFQIFSVRNYYKILSIVPCAIE